MLNAYFKRHVDILLTCLLFFSDWKYSYHEMNHWLMAQEEKYNFIKWAQTDVNQELSKW